jgi:1,4-alpha-glucan branching enzyme
MGIDADQRRAGQLLLVLHAHLPFVRHPEHEEFLEEDWLYEAITETYLPLLGVLEGWARDGIPARLTMSLSPTLVEMLRDPLLLSRYERRLERLLRLAEREVRRTAEGDPRLLDTARMYLGQLTDAYLGFTRTYDRDLVDAFSSLERRGVLELIACSATHAFLPLLATTPSEARAQVRLGVAAHRHQLGVNPPGIWLPECGYFPGLEQVLADEGLTYFISDTHAVLFAQPPPVLGSFAPIVTPSGVLAFPRDPDSSRQVWSADEGYPGDPRYREFYRDVGHDLPADQLEGLIQPTGARKNTGIKYHRITGRQVPLESKELYDRRAALEAVEAQAAHFVEARRQQLEHWSARLGRAAVVVAPYDAELFGHWWFEGPWFLDRVVRRAAAEPTLRLSTPGDVIRSGASFQRATPAASSWGDKGYAEVWCNGKNDWVWPALHRAQAELARLVEAHPRAEGLMRRALAQLGRELLLASASDWPFIISMGTMVDYAERRLEEHLAQFDALARMVREGALDEARIAALEAKDCVFAELDPSVFARS